jgi:hypothetical protein
MSVDRPESAATKILEIRRITTVAVLNLLHFTVKPIPDP